ncbi:ferredoxin [Micromonosporaceae bacterium Da 78-11]
MKRETGLRRTGLITGALVAASVAGTVATGTSPSWPGARWRPRSGSSPPACDGRGLCVELLPELIVEDDWGFPVLDGNVPPALEPNARRAVDRCPALALRLLTT